MSKTSKSRSAGGGGSGALSFEDALAQIESIIERIESGDVGLEQSLNEYEKGVALIGHCRAKLDGARKQVEDLTRKLEAADEQEVAETEGADEEGQGEESSESSV